MMTSITTTTTLPPHTTSHLNYYSLHLHKRLVQNHPVTFPPTKRRRFIPYASVLHLPLLPFPLDEVAIPCEAKTLHLFEARYLALLDESLIKTRRQFVHFVLDPIALSKTSAEVSFAARYGCLVMIEKVEQLDVGALVSIRGIGRVKIVQFDQAEPFLRGAVVPLQDNVVGSETEINFKMVELKEVLQTLNGLEMKLKAPQKSLLQTQVANCLMWAENVPDWDCDKTFLPTLPERLSFAPLQPITGSSLSELINLQNEKVRAMDAKDTLERLERSIEFARNNISVVAAKLAIQSLEVQ